MSPEAAAQHRAWYETGRATGRPEGLTFDELIRYRHYGTMARLDAVGDFLDARLGISDTSLADGVLFMRRCPALWPINGLPPEVEAALAAESLTSEKSNGQE
jgi:hypothetical protein